MFVKLHAQERAVVTVSRQSRDRIALMHGRLEWLGTLVIPESRKRHEAIKNVFPDAIHDVSEKMAIGLSFIHLTHTFSLGGHALARLPTSDKVARLDHRRHRGWRGQLELDAKSAVIRQGN